MEIYRYVEKRPFERSASEIRTEIETLPKGNISEKKIKGKSYPYLQWTEDGKRRTKLIKKDDLPETMERIERRKTLERELAQCSLSGLVPVRRFECVRVEYPIEKSTDVFFSTVDVTQQRDAVHKFLKSKQDDGVCLVYGYSQKFCDSFMKHVRHRLEPQDLIKTAVIKLTGCDKVKDLFTDLDFLKQKNVKYVFIEYLDMLEDFWLCSHLILTEYASAGMKIVMSSYNPLFCTMVTNFVWHDQVECVKLPLPKYEKPFFCENIKSTVDLMNRLIKHFSKETARGIDFQLEEIEKYAKAASKPILTEKQQTLKDCQDLLDVTDEQLF